MLLRFSGSTTAVFAGWADGGGVGIFAVSAGLVVSAAFGASGFAVVPPAIPPVSTLALVSKVTSGFDVLTAFTLSGLDVSEVGTTSFLAPGAKEVVTSCGLFAAAVVLVLCVVVPAFVGSVLGIFSFAADGAGFEVALAGVFDVAPAEDARDVGVDLPLPMLGVFDFATLKTFPILTDCQVIQQS
jgi:hypothetical protein